MIRWVVGLGNPGADYEGTRHNAGFEVVDRVAAGAGLGWRNHWFWPAWSATGRLDGAEVRLVKPRTFMNRSGEVLRKALRRGVRSEQILVVYDDLDLPCGQLRVRTSGGHGGHNGMRSLAAVMGTTDFPRLRVGIGPRPEGTEVIDYVLGRWESDQQTVWSEVRERAAAAVTLAVRDSVDRAMNEFNRAA